MEEKWRKLGGSDVGPVANNEPRSAFEVYLRAAEGVEIESTWHMKAGVLMEDLGREEYEREHGVKVVKPEAILPADREWLRAQPDGIISEWGEGWEFKFRSPFMRHEYGDPGTDEIPTHELLQDQLYMEVTGLPVWHHVVAFGGPPLVLYRVERSRELGDRILDMLHGFWEQHIVPRKPPRIDGPRASKLLDGVWPKHDDALIKADEKTARAMRLLHRLKDTQKRAEMAETAIQNELKQIIGEHSGIEVGGLVATWKRPRKSLKTDWQAVAQEYRNMLELEWAARSPTTADRPERKALDETIARFTHEKENSRRFLLMTKKGET